MFYDFIILLWRFYCFRSNTLREPGGKGILLKLGILQLMKTMTFHHYSKFFPLLYNFITFCSYTCIIPKLCYAVPPPRISC